MSFSPADFYPPGPGTAAGGAGVDQTARDAAAAAQATADSEVSRATAADGGHSARLTSLEAAPTTGRKGYATLAALNADLTPADGFLAEVTNDPTPANNLPYRKSGASGAGSWVAYLDRLTFDAGSGQSGASLTDQATPAYSKAALVYATWQADNAHASTFAGWASAFTHNGVPFDTVRIYINVEQPTQSVRVCLRDSSFTTILCETRRVVVGANAYAWLAFKLPKRITSAAGTIMFVSIQSSGNTSRLRGPNLVLNTAYRPTWATYKDKYTTTTLAEGAAWFDSTADQNPGRVLFELYDSVSPTYTPAQFAGALLAGGITQKVPVTGYASVTPLVTATGVSTGARNTVFAGWGEVRNRTAGQSFNAIRLPALGRGPAVAAADRWATLTVEVRGTDNTGPLLAVGSAAVDQLTDSFSNLVVLLRDPTTDALLTLGDTQLGTTGTFWTAYVAMKPDGINKAVCSETLGTVPDYVAGTSKYLQQSSGLWSSFTGNPSLGIELVTANSPTFAWESHISDAGAPVGLTSRVAALEQATVGGTLDVQLPPILHGVVGRELSMYFDGLVPDRGSRYLWDVICSVGQQQDERFTATPAAAGTYPITVAAYDEATGAQKGTASGSVVVAAAGAAAGGHKVLFFGDSLVADGTITQTLLDLSAADGVTLLTLLGTRGSGANQHEGRGGWTANDFATAGRVFYSFTVSGLAQLPDLNSATYTNNSSTFRVQEIHLTGGAGTLVCDRTAGSNDPTASGVLTKSFGNGQATINFSSWALAPGNPFWNAGSSSLDFNNYLTVNGLVGPIDILMCQLGVNDVFGAASDSAADGIAGTVATQLDSIVAAARAHNAAIKVVIGLTTFPSAHQDAFGANYACGQTRWRQKRNVHRLIKGLIGHFSGQTGSGLWLGQAVTSLDAEHNMQVGTSAPWNARATTSTQRQSNGVHPAPSGYQQIGDQAWATLKAIG